MAEKPEPSGDYWDQVATYLDSDALHELETLAHKLKVSVAEAARLAAQAAEHDPPWRAEQAF